MGFFSGFGFGSFVLETWLRSVYEVKYITRTTGRGQATLSFLCFSEMLPVDSTVSCAGAQLIHKSVHCVRRHETTDPGGLGSPATHYNCIYSSELNNARNCSWALKCDCPQNNNPRNFFCQRQLLLSQSILVCNLKSSMPYLMFPTGKEELAIL